MYIGIDGNEANVERRVGIGEYAYQLILNLFNLRDSNKFQIFLKNPPLHDFPGEQINWKYTVFGPKILWTQLAFPIKLLFNRKLKLIFSPSHYAPRFSPVPTVISIMDLSFIRFPQMFTVKDLWQLKRWTRYSVSKAKKIITISEFSKNEILNFYQVKPDKVVVTYPGFNKNIYNTNYQEAELTNIKKLYNLNDYIIYVGTIQPRKNLDRLIRAYENILDKFPSLKLVIVGKRGWLFGDIMKLINADKYQDKIVYTDYLEARSIAKLYSGAKAFVLPSLYEGFGLTVVEAMACACPVVISNSSSLPEVAGDAGIYFDPYSVKSITGAIIKVLNFTEDARKTIIRKSLIKANNYSWKRCASETLKIFAAMVSN